MAKRIGRRADVFAKVTGKAQYANDLYFKEMLFVKVIRSPHAHAKVTSIELEQAEQYPGVVKVLTSDHIPGIIAQPKEKPILANLVRYVGEGVALVVAESLEIAEEASKLVEIEYEILPAVFKAEDALKEDAPQIYEDGNILCEFNTNKGDVAKGFEEADFILEKEYTTQRVQHAAIEPEAAVAVPSLDEEMTIYVPANDPFNARRVVAETLGVPLNEIRVKMPTIGGSFGGKSYDAWAMASRVALAAKYTGRICKIVYSREESILEGTKRHPYVVKYKAGIKKDGRITAIETNIVGDGGAYKSKSFPVASRSCIEAIGAYVVPNVKNSITLAYTNNVYSDALRGFGSPQVAFSSELLMDEIAKELDMDPIEFRRLNSFKEDSVSGVGQVMKDVSLQECLDQVEKAIDWKTRKAELAEFRKNHKGKVRGVGIALLHRGEAFGAAGQGLDAAAVALHIQKDGSAIVLSSMSEVGNGCHAMLRSVVSKTLGIRMELIKVRPVDTSYVPDSGPTVATRGTVIIGTAMKDAADKIKEKLVKLAAKKLGTDELEIVLSNEEAHSVENPDKKISYFDLIQEIYASGDHAYAHGWYAVNWLKWNKAEGNGDAYLSYAYGACAAEVEVDLETGQVSVEKFYAAHDVGNSFDAEEVMGQINGGVSMGVGYATIEEVEMKDGSIKNLNLDKYLIPTAMDMPDTTPIVVEHPSKTGPYGARGLGEPVATSVAPAIINAIADATGIYIRDIPASLEKVLAEVRATQEKNNKKVLS